ncbi:MAG: response regulator transcription factor [Acidobacteriota bacterium]
MKPRRARKLDAFPLRVGGEELVVISLPDCEGVAAGELTPAEREVAADVIAGLSNVAIARRRRRSPRTVANQLASIYRKLGVGSRAELAARLGL